LVLGSNPSGCTNFPKNPSKKMTPEEISKAFLKILCKQSFKDWYETEFEEYIVAEDGAPTEAQILKELSRLVAQELR